MVKYSFPIFVKEKKSFKFVTILINLGILAFISLVSYFLVANEWLENSFVWIIYVLIMATLVAYLNKMFKREKYTPNGSLNGELSFYRDKIMIGENIIPIEQIRMINIKNDDFMGKEVKEFGEFKREEGSFGVNNIITIQDKNQEFFETKFKQESRKEFENMRPILLEYANQGILDYEDLIYLLKIEYDIDKQELKKDLGMNP